MDLANYFNETMLDNAYPIDKGIKYYLQNFIKDSEQEFMIKKYLEHYYENYIKTSEEKTEENKQRYVDREYPKFQEECNKCLLLNNYFWAVWSLKMLKDEKMGDPNVFNFEFAKSRVHMYNHVKGLYFDKA